MQRSRYYSRDAFERKSDGKMEICSCTLHKTKEKIFKNIKSILYYILRITLKKICLYFSSLMLIKVKILSLRDGVTTRNKNKATRARYREITYDRTMRDVRRSHVSKMEGEVVQVLHSRWFQEKIISGKDTNNEMFRR